MIYNAKLIHQAQAGHGESSWWDDRKNVMLYMDCIGSRMFYYDPVSETPTEIQLPFNPMAVIGCENGGYIAASEDTVFLLDDAFKVKKELIKVSHGKSTDRFNDCKCGPDGAFYMGSMGTLGEEDEGKLYRLSPDGELSIVIDKVGISNGFAWTKDQKTLYYTDTIHGEIYAYDFADGKTSNKRTVFCDKSISPDGMCIDSLDRLWVAFWESGKVVCIEPKTGEIIHEVLTEGALLSSSAMFGGENLDTLFITTSRLGMTDDEIAKRPLSGSLYAIKTDASGVLPFRGKF